MNAVEGVILFGWVVFWIGWLAASTGVKPGRVRWGQFAGVRVLIILAVVLLVRFKVIRAHTVMHDPWLQGIGLALFVLGLALAVWARVFIGRNWGMPMTRKADPELVTTGPYRFVRHPIYSGIILAMLGTAVAVSLYWLVALVLLGAYFIYSAFTEERDMAERFPDAYPAYKRTTKMLIPFVF
jgi:protein-S-isoprenylcysteine O-methyltransferase Ste14